VAKKTPLYDKHLQAGGSMVEFAGYDMPQQYTSIKDEHIAVRQRAGLFDISHMGEVYLSGPGAEATAQRLVANDVSRLQDGAALYGVMCNPQGGIVDDVIVYRDGPEHFMIVINAACRDKDVAWIREHAIDVQVEDRSDDIALLAVQGPSALDVVRTISGGGIGDIPSFHCIEGRVGGVPARISRTGYTGEDGVELYVASSDAPAVWDAVVEAGKSVDLRCCGLGARDTLRLEAGLRLYGQDMNDTVDPFSCGLAWTVKMEAGDFIGRDALAKLDRKNPPRRFVGLSMPERTIARHDQAVYAGGAEVGVVTSGGFSFTLGHGIATASVNPDISSDAALTIDVRGNRTEAQRVPLPFYKRPVPAGGHVRG
jgi:aminomethyltransferase